jgi:hypothetical protein
MRRAAEKRRFMTIKPGAILGSTVLLLLVAGPPVPTVRAGLVTVDFSGTVTAISGPNVTAATGVAPNDVIKGDFTYDSSQTGSGGFYNFTGSANIHSFEFTVYDPTGKTQLFNDLYSGNVTAYYAIQMAFSSIIGTTLDLVGNTVFEQGRGYTGTNPPGYDLTMFNPSNGGGYSANNLPLPGASSIKFFEIFSGKFMWGIPAIGDTPALTFTASITAYNGINTVPEPSSLLVATLAALAATGAHGVLTWRRRRAMQH